MSDATTAPKKHSLAGLLLAAFFMAGAAVAAGTLAGVLLGALSGVAYVIGLEIIVIGLAVGAAVGVASLITDPRRSRYLVVAALLAGVVVGWLSVQATEDFWFRASFRDDLAHSRFAASGVPITDYDPADLEFYGHDADLRLAEEVQEHVGVEGPVGRWLYRADSGVRLLGPWSSSRGVPVGRTGALIWSLLEILLAAGLARAVATKAVAASAVSPRSE